MILRTILAACLILLCMQSCKKAAQTTIPPEYTGKTAAELIEEGMKYHGRKEFQKSSELFLYASLKEPNNHVAFFNQACALSLLGRKDEAIQALSQAAKLNPIWIKQNMNDPDLASIRSERAFTELFAGEAASNDIAGRRICRLPPGPQDTAQIRITLNPDKTVAGTGSRTGASLNLEFESGSWNIADANVNVKLHFVGSSYGPGGESKKAEDFTFSVNRDALLNYSGDCLEIPRF